MNNAPEKIYISKRHHDQDYHLSEVTVDHQYLDGSEIEYVRADVYQELMKKLLDSQSIAIDRGNQLINLIAQKGMQNDERT